MPEIEPQDFRIMLALQERLQAIQVSDGYYYTVPASAVRFSHDINIEDLTAEDSPRPFIVIALTDDPHEHYQSPDELQVTLKIRIYWVSNTVPTSDVSRLQVYLRGCADVERALMGQDRSLGGNATDIKLVNRSLEDDMGAQVDAAIDLEIVFYRTLGNPLGV